MSFQKKLTIHFDECDPAGIIFFGRQFHIAHQLLESYVQELGIPWKQWFQSDEYAIPIVHAEADYKAPLMAGHTYNGKVRVQSLGETSVTFIVEIESLDGQPCSTIQTVHAFMSLQDKKKMAIPASLRKQLDR